MIEEVCFSFKLFIIIWPEGIVVSTSTLDQMNVSSLHYCTSASVGGGVLHTLERDDSSQRVHRGYARDEPHGLKSDAKDPFR